MLFPTRFVVDATETAKKKAWRQKCAAPRLVYDSALFFETCMYVNVRITYDQVYLTKKKKIPPHVRSLDGRVEHV